jgi:hypothetical protein
MNSSGTWDFDDIIGQATLWFPSPEWAHQLIEGVLNAWVEQPWATEAFFFIPRVFQRDWGRVTKQIEEIGVFPSSLIPVYGSQTDIPCVALPLPCYVCCVPTPRWMDPPPRPKGGSGIGSRQSSCMGCHKCLRRDTLQHLCRFAMTGFELDGWEFLPCGTTYHLGCIRVGEPFRTRLGGNRGLSYPRIQITHCSSVKPAQFVPN